MRTTGFPLPVRIQIIERAAGRCERCGADGPNPQAHHRRVKGMGGDRRPETQSVSNGLWVDANCHTEIHANPAASYEHGWLVRQHEDPAAVPVLTASGWALLNPDGSVLPVEEPNQEETA